MFEALDDIKKYGSVITIVISFILIAISGALMGFTYYTLETVQTGFESTDCVIQNNTLVESCQDLWTISIYPFLNLKDVLIWFSFFFIFALVIGMLLYGYQSGKSPVMMGVLMVFIIGLTYLSIEISNMYRTMLENEIFRNMMIDFTVYNKIMLNFPWFCFFVGLFSVTLSLVNYQKVKTNKFEEDLDY